MPGRCRQAIEAASSILSEETCDDGEFASVNVGDGTLMWVPQEAKDEIGVSLNSPETEEERMEAIESCMDSEWARETAEAFAGEEPEAREAVARRLCEGLFD